MSEPTPLDDPSRETVDFSKLPPIPESGSPRAAEWWLAQKHLRSKKGEAFLSLVTVLSIVGVVAGVAILNWVIGVMTGFEVDLRDKILGANAHVITRRYSGYIVDAERVSDSIEEIQGVRAAAPFVYGEAMIRTPGHEGGGVVFKGLDPERHGDVTALMSSMDFGPDGELTTDEAKLEIFRSLAHPIPPPEWDDEGSPMPGIIIGRVLAQTLDVGPGQLVTAVNPIGGGMGPMGVPMPSVGQFRIAATYHSGMYEYDSKWTYVHNATAQDFMNRGEAWDGIEIALDDIDDAVAVSERISDTLGYPFYSSHWMETHAKLFDALRLEKYVMGLILSMIVFVAALLIVTTLIMLVITKAREIAILKAMGAGRGTILRIFVIEGSLIGLIGTILGTILGVAGCFFLRWYGYPLETDVYYLSELPVVIDPRNIITIAVGAFTICFIATLYPAYRASLLDPVEGLRYE
ncbi:MAG: lipoprotein-releasing system permease protein [Myxococcota bacterium]